MVIIIPTAKIYLPNGRYAQRVINQLYPLEVTDELHEVNQVSNENAVHSLQDAGCVKESEKAPRLLLPLSKELINSYS